MAVLNFQVVPISQVVLKTGSTVLITPRLLGSPSPSKDRRTGQMKDYALQALITPYDTYKQEVKGPWLSAGQLQLG